jgi:hypothetical protein
MVVDVVEMVEEGGVPGLVAWGKRISGRSMERNDVGHKRFVCVREAYSYIQRSGLVRLRWALNREYRESCDGQRATLTVIK